MSTVGIKEELEGDLTVRFRKATHKIHNLSNSLVSARLLLLFTDKTLYGRALSCFYLVHKQLDESLRVAIEHGDADIKAFGPLMQEAARTAAFEKDLDFFLGPGWREQVVRTPAVDAYVAHLAHLQEHDPLGLLAHAYTQHMSLLAGGRILKKAMQKAMRLTPDGPGTAVFTFPPRDRTGRGLRGDYKDAINSLGRELPPARQQGLVDECVRAFELNNGIMRAFPMGFKRPALGAVQLLAGTWWVQAAVVAAAGLAAWRYWR